MQGVRGVGASAGWQNAYSRFNASELLDGVGVWGAFFGSFGIELALVLHRPRS